MMTKLEFRFLELLRDAKKRNVLTRTGSLGQAIWGRRKKRMPQAYARPAGRVLNRLKAQGWARWTVQEQPRDWGWEITPEGEMMVNEILIQRGIFAVAKMEGWL